MDPRRITTIFLVVGAIGLVALAIEWLRMRLNGWLALIVVSLVLLVMALLIHGARAHDHSRPELNDWMKDLHARGGAWCCIGDDTDLIDDWEIKGNRYRVKFRGQWFDVPEGAIVEGPNKSGAPLLWMNKGLSGLSPRCFMPGTMS